MDITLWRYASTQKYYKKMYFIPNFLKLKSYYIYNLGAQILPLEVKT